mmetsp:Transcript_30455/g.66934  ORF Transcript_30455/g.66934 Transcript_30455/m.66934 type:complete len:246 (+) Transcript_30455:2002-2739(+)
MFRISDNIVLWNSFSLKGDIARVCAGGLDWDFDGITSSFSASSLHSDIPRAGSEKSALPDARVCRGTTTLPVPDGRSCCCACLRRMRSIASHLKRSSSSCVNQLFPSSSSYSTTHTLASKDISLGSLVSNDACLVMDFFLTAAVPSPLASTVVPSTSAVRVTAVGRLRSVSCDDAMLLSDDTLRREATDRRDDAEPVDDSSCDLCRRSSSEGAFLRLSADAVRLGISRFSPPPCDGRAFSKLTVP